MLIAHNSFKVYECKQIFQFEVPCIEELVTVTRVICVKNENRVNFDSKFP